MNFLDILKDTLCGCASGVAQVITMMPIENIITKMIEKPDKYYGVLQSINKTISQEGIMSFYKGMLFPLIGVGFQVSLQFGVVETLKKMMKNKFSDKDGKLGLPYIALSGLIAGIPSAITSTPLDHARFRVLMNPDNKGPGSLRTTAIIYQKYGIRKVFLGLNATLLRQMVGLSIYFSSYDRILPLVVSYGLSYMNAAFYSGGIAGLLTWIVIYPIHYVKVKIQNDSLENPKYRSAFQCAFDLYKSNQTSVMYRKVQLMLVRAFLVNAAGFLAFQNCKKFLYQKN